MSRPLPCFMPEAALEKSALEAERRRREAIDVLTRKLGASLPVAEDGAFADSDRRPPRSDRR
jgi:hypothetical protein